MNPHRRIPQGLFHSQRQFHFRRSLAGIAPTTSPPPTTTSSPPKRTKRRNVFSAITDSQPDLNDASGSGNAAEGRGADDIQNNPHPSLKVRILYRDEQEQTLRERVETLTSQIESLHKDQQERAEESRDMAKMLKRVEAELTLKKAAVLDFKACCGAPRCDDWYNLDKAAQALCTDLPSSDQDLQFIADLVSAAREEAGGINQMLQEKNEQLANLDGQLVSLRKDLQTVRSEKDELEAANGKLNNELGVEAVNLLKRETSFIAGMNMVQKQQKKHITQAEADSTHIAKLEEECSKLKEKLSKNVLSRSIQTQNITKLEEEKNRLLADKQMAEEKLHSKQEKIQSLQRSKEELEKKIEKLTKNQAAVDESRQLQEFQITNIQSDRDSLAQRLENNKVEISKLQALLESKGEEILQLSNRVEDLNDETQVEMNNEVERLKEQHKEAVEECTELKNSRAALKADQKLDVC
ncbi:hypothetical protein BT96DRAFT_1009697 [Gymnopus androsaceus JB14]|uniref:Uncharacterized protein n=1 Tax=Gymnopus androsaceus JB14 TaxID=1447944 RepID=A0A6A4GC19_9AGAR|nr:hypothetical protein BT96DRAFT_1009697 [Gymnopus androsaceus JB14]